MEKLKLKEYLDAEISVLKDLHGIRWIIRFLDAMLYYPEYNAIFLLRFCYVYLNARGIIGLLRKHYNRVLVNRYGIYFNMSSQSVIGVGLKLPHPSSIIFGSGVKIGDNCVIYQNVTLGAKKRDPKIPKGHFKYPIIGDNCIIYAGAVIIGEIHIADGSQIGANSVLLTDTEKDSIYAGVPAKRIG